MKHAQVVGYILVLLCTLLVGCEEERGRRWSLWVAVDNQSRLSVSLFIDEELEFEVEPGKSGFTSKSVVSESQHLITLRWPSSNVLLEQPVEIPFDTISLRYEVDLGS
jgi:hypothetical protein